jgi:hypothetical protein
MEDRLRMHPLVRGFSAYIAFQAGSVALAFFVLQSSLPLPISMLVGVAGGLLMARALWRLPETTFGDLLHATGIGAAAIGGICLVLGMVIPMIIHPGSNIAPVIGLLYTGPIGAVVGALCGATRWMLRWSRSPG